MSPTTFRRGWGDHPQSPTSDVDRRRRRYSHHATTLTKSAGPRPLRRPHLQGLRRAGGRSGCEEDITVLAEFKELEDLAAAIGDDHKVGPMSLSPGRRRNRRWADSVRLLYRIATTVGIGTPGWSLKAGHARSAVTAVRFSTEARAKQARPPMDSPWERVQGSNAAVTNPCAEV